jgi:putative endonuclease
MFTVYAIYSKAIDNIYVGQTSDLAARLKSHKEYNKGFTARADDWQLIYFEEFENRSLALKREKQLKSGNGRVFLRSLL